MSGPLPWPLSFGVLLAPKPDEQPHYSWRKAMVIGAAEASAEVNVVAVDVEQWCIDQGWMEVGAVFPISWVAIDDFEQVP